MADIYKVNSDKIIGGPGRLVVKDYDGTFPDTISEVMDISAPYDLKAGWKDLGATTDGITTSRSFDTEDFEVDQQVGAVDTEISSWEHTLETTLAENTVENRQLAMIGGTIIETTSTYGTETTISNALTNGSTIIKVASAAGIQVGSFVLIEEMENVETKKVAAVNSNTITLDSPITKTYTTAATVTPITELGYKRIGFGTVNFIPFKTYALISQKKDGSLVMAVIRKAKVSGDAKEQVYGKEKRTIPLALSAFPVDGVPGEENVYYELEQVMAP